MAPPFELKRRPILDVLSHGAGYGVVAFLLGAAGCGGPWGVGDLRAGSLASLPYTLGIMTGHSLDPPQIEMGASTCGF